MIDEKRLLKDVGFYAHMCPCGEQASEQFLTDWINKQPTIDMQKYEEEIRADERARTIDEFLSKVKILLCEPFVFEWLEFNDFVRIAEEMKGENDG